MSPHPRVSLRRHISNISATATGEQMREHKRGGLENTNVALSVPLCSLMNSRDAGGIQSPMYGFAARLAAMARFAPIAQPDRATPS